MVTKKWIIEREALMLASRRKDNAVTQDEVTKEFDKVHKCLQNNFLVIQSLRDELNDFSKALNINVQDSPSKRALDYQQKLAEHQDRVNGLAGMMVDGIPPAPSSHERNG